MGAKVIEKHITLSNKMAGPDHLSSLEAKDFKNFADDTKLGPIKSAKSLGKKCAESLLKKLNTPE